MLSAPRRLLPVFAFRGPRIKADGAALPILDSADIEEQFISTVKIKIR